MDRDIPKPEMIFIITRRNRISAAHRKIWFVVAHYVLIVPYFLPFEICGPAIRVQLLINDSNELCGICSLLGDNRALICSRTAILCWRTYVNPTAFTQRSNIPNLNATTALSNAALLVLWFKLYENIANISSKNRKSREITRHQRKLNRNRSSIATDKHPSKHRLWRSRSVGCSDDRPNWPDWPCVIYFEYGNGHIRLHKTSTTDDRFWSSLLAIQRIYPPI